jgi:hypothetical protein
MSSFHQHEQAQQLDEGQPDCREARPWGVPQGAQTMAELTSSQTSAVAIHPVTPCHGPWTSHSPIVNIQQIITSTSKAKRPNALRAIFHSPGGLLLVAHLQVVQLVEAR